MQKGITVNCWAITFHYQHPVSPGDLFDVFLQAPVWLGSKSQVNPPLQPKTYSDSNSVPWFIWDYYYIVDVMSLGGIQWKHHHHADFLAAQDLPDASWQKFNTRLAGQGKNQNKGEECPQSQLICINGIHICYPHMLNMFWYFLVAMAIHTNYHNPNRHRQAQAIQRCGQPSRPNPGPQRHRLLGGLEQ